MKYTAFISYRHGGIDEKAAMQIHRHIERYHIPHKLAKTLGRKNMGKIFRDSEELKAASNLSEIIRKALDETEWLIIICTKRFKESPWCMEEVEYFIKIRGRERIIVILAEGEPSESFPKILTEIEQDGKIVLIEPLAVDIRGNSESQVLRNLKREKFRFLAGMLEVDYDDLKQRQKERKRKFITTVVSAAALAIGTFAVVVMRKNFQLKEAYSALGNSMQQTLKGQSYYLAEYSSEAYNNGDKKTAAMLALEALPEDLSNPGRPYVESAMRYLTTALGIYDFSTGYQADRLFDMEQEAYDTKVQASSDHKVILIERYDYAANNMLQRHADVYSLESGDRLCSYNTGTINRQFYSGYTRCSWLLSDSSTLIYTGEDGLVSVDIYTGKENFRAKKASELKVSTKEDLIVTIDYETGNLYSFNMKGENILECSLGSDIEYTLYDISPDSSTVALSANTSKINGILLINSRSGENVFLNQHGLCEAVVFSSGYKLCFLKTDTEAGLKHIVEYNINKGKENYLCDADWDLKTMQVTDKQTCFYYHGAKIYEVDNKSGEIVWEYTFASEVISICTGSGYLGISCEDGSVYFYETESKTLINTQAGNKEPFYFMYIDSKYACLRDYWGKDIRIYNRSRVNRNDVKSCPIFNNTENLPDKWYTGSASGDNFLMGFASGSQRIFEIFDASQLVQRNSTSISDLGYSSFENLTIDIPDSTYFSIRDYGTYENKHYTIDGSKVLMEYSENSYYYYNEDNSVIFISDNNDLKKYNAATGDIIETFYIPDGYDKGVCTDGYKIFSSSSQICIQNVAGGTEEIIKDAELYSFHEKRGLVFYRTADGTGWYVYSLKDNKIVCSGTSGNYSCTMFFGGGRYFLNDYSEVYDMDSWKKVLDLSSISNGVYGVQTTDSLPYFVVWYQDSDAKNKGKTKGTNIAYIYNKANTGEAVAEIPNYVTTTSDGQIIVYDGAHTLYKVPLYTAADIIKKAKEYIGNSKFTDYQKDKYHLFTD
ncbi:MAG: TIR domain-containing protein [Lachnospiraceae bacterium]